MIKKRNNYVFLLKDGNNFIPHHLNKLTSKPQETLPGQI